MRPQLNLRNESNRKTRPSDTGNGCWQSQPGMCRGKQLVLLQQNSAAALSAATEPLRELAQSNASYETTKCGLEHMVSRLWGVCCGRGEDGTSVY